MRGEKGKRRCGRAHLGRPQTGDGVLHRDDEFHNHGKQQLQQEIRNQAPLDDGGAGVVVAVNEGGGEQEVEEGGGGWQVVDSGAQTADVAEADDFRGHCDCNEGEERARTHTHKYTPAMKVTHMPTAMLSMVHTTSVQVCSSCSIDSTRCTK